MKNCSPLYHLVSTVTPGLYKKIAFNLLKGYERILSVFQLIEKLQRVVELRENFICRRLEQTQGNLSAFCCQRPEFQSSNYGVNIS